MAIIDKPSDYFNTKLYTGNGGTQSITGLDFQPDWVWIKSRTEGYGHSLFDSVRGATKALQSEGADAEYTFSTGLTAFNSDGFTLGSGTVVNNNSQNHVSWNWKAGGTASSNTDGSITSSVSANATSGFSIVSYTGTGSASTVGHGLGVAPSVVICKQLNATQQWINYHSSLGATEYLHLNATDASATNSTVWNDTEPTSSVFSIGTAVNCNQSSGTYISYCFAEKQGYSKFGSYTGGSDAFVYLGFKPSFIMFKNASAVENWRTVDNKRDIDNPVVAHLYPNLSNAEGSGAAYSDYIDFLSNGFKIRSGSGEIDGSGNTIIYMAFAENPFVTSTGVPATAR